MSFLSTLRSMFPWMFPAPAIPTFGAAQPVTEGHVPVRTLSLYGDSISWAANLNPTPAQALGAIATVTNWAIAGMRLRDMMGFYKAPLQPTVLQPLAQQIASDPSAVVLMRLGINDANQDTDLLQFVNMQRVFIAACRNSGKVPVLGGLTNMTLAGTDPSLAAKMQVRRAEFNSAIQSVAAENGVHFIDISSVPYSWTDLPDGLHPGQEYSNRVNALIIDYFNSHQIFA